MHHSTLTLRIDAFMQRQTTGSSLNVVAPAGDLYSISNNIVANSGGGCSQITAGTSFAAPVVSGIVGKRVVCLRGPCHCPRAHCGSCKLQASCSTSGSPVSTIALMLQVNPNLGWRDVQAILSETSQQADPTDSSWVINGGGLHHSYEYGKSMHFCAWTGERACGRL
jgi:hypothetical protein